jgi:predicted RNase H-like HicB family nuclease
LDDARKMAEEALTFHVEGLVEDGETIPEPSTLEEIMSDPDNRSGVAILVSLRSEQSA